MNTGNIEKILNMTVSQARDNVRNFRDKSKEIESNNPKFLAQVFYSIEQASLKGEKEVSIKAGFPIDSDVIWRELEDRGFKIESYCYLDRSLGTFVISW